MKMFDKEYKTQYMKEVDFLTNKGIRYTFVKRSNDDVRTYKYAKTRELFNALVEFYSL
ncbi:hypothetical protein [Clostridium aciditolerans]|uniref:Uncharacterized protein n=1 Tax=Clostridium aciditolerans TaxID=339861 RepID=A0A934HVX9_9CLOT|nr:hypothetical protein [Clostridium aciditolerans]MBI6875601.1 hypothetical protein [Clostridium aciditolerans]